MKYQCLKIVFSSFVVLLLVSTITTAHDISCEASDIIIENITSPTFEGDFDPNVNIKIKVTINEIRAFDELDKNSEADFYVKVFINDEEFISPVWRNKNVVYDHCWEPQALIAGGWTPWAGRENTCFYREYECFGPGSDTTNRVFFGKQLDPAKADRYVKDTIFTVSNFPTYLGYTGDTAELMKVYRRFEVSGYPERADTILYAGRDHYPEYPTDKCLVVMKNIFDNKK